MKKLILVWAIIFSAVAALHAAEAPPEAQAASTKLLTAIEADDYPAFIADGDDAFKGLKKEMFDSVAAQLIARFRGGYEVTYLGEMKQRGYQITLWKLSFKDGGDDALATLSLKDGKIGGYWIR